MIHSNQATHLLVDPLSPGPRSATVTAATDCQFLPIDAGRFQFLLQQTPNFALHVMRTMADRLRGWIFCCWRPRAPADLTNFSRVADF
jgi:CRP-like cAMP-binding protein